MASGMVGGRDLSSVVVVVKSMSRHEMTSTRFPYVSMNGGSLRAPDNKVMGQRTELVMSSISRPPERLASSTSGIDLSAPLAASSGSRGVYCVVEFELASGDFIGRVVGFPYVELRGSNVEDVQAKLRRTITDMTQTASLVLETELRSVFCIPIRS